MKTGLCTLCATVLLLTTTTSTADTPATGSQEMSPEQAQYLEFAKKIWDSLDRQHGNIKLANNIAMLNLGEKFYYLKPSDAEKILVKVWGNPDGAGYDTLGMIFPEEMTPFDQNAWGVTIHYEEDGYVKDEDADDINYDDLLSQMKEDVETSSNQRVSQGFEPIELVGWAAKPYYDKQAHKLHWAKEIKFGSQPINTLNYNIRVLGRKGVLVLNFISGMDQKAAIDNSIDTVLAVAEFEPGSRYEDFTPGMDKVAAYGIGALVAGKVIAKTGALAALLIFFKKFWILLVIAVGAFLRKLFGRKAEASE